MKESVTYQAILEEGEERGLKKGLEKGLEQGLEQGRLLELRRMILRLGAQRFGSPPASVVQWIETNPSLGALEQVGGRLLAVESWDELLAEK